MMLSKERVQDRQSLRGSDARWEQQLHQVHPGRSSKISLWNASHEQQGLPGRLWKGDPVLLERALWIHFVAVRPLASWFSGRSPSLRLSCRAPGICRDSSAAGIALGLVGRIFV